MISLQVFTLCHTRYELIFHVCWVPGLLSEFNVPYLLYFYCDQLKNIWGLLLLVLTFCALAPGRTKQGM